jgi:hypothetical protein
MPTFLSEIFLRRTFLRKSYATRAHVSSEEQQFTKIFFTEANCEQKLTDDRSEELLAHRAIAKVQFPNLKFQISDHAWLIKSDCDP